MRAPPGPDASLSAKPQLNRQTHPQDPRAKRTTAKGTRRVLAVGDHVCCERVAPARGSWIRFVGRVGVVVSINVSRSVRDDTADVVEYAVRFTMGHNGTIAFRDDELLAVAVGLQAADGRLGDAGIGRPL